MSLNMPTSVVGLSIRLKEITIRLSDNEYNDYVPRMITNEKLFSRHNVSVGTDVEFELVFGRYEKDVIR